MQKVLEVKLKQCGCWLVDQWMSGLILMKLPASMR